MSNSNPFPNLRIKWRIVTPAQAAALLEGNTANRNLRSPKVGQYSHDIVTDCWGFSDSMIVIAEDGTVINGQHRLHAVVTSGKSCWFAVATGVPQEAVFDMDQGMGRTFQQAWNLYNEPEFRISCRVASLCRYAFSASPFHPAEGKVSHHQYFRLMERRWDACMFTDKAFGPSNVARVTIGPVLAVVARAWYTVDRKRLAQFAEVLTSGVSSGERDSAAIRLRNALMLDDSGGRSTREMAYKKTERALSMFLAGKPLKRLYAVDHELYEVPGE